MVFSRNQVLTPRVTPDKRTTWPLTQSQGSDARLALHPVDAQFFLFLRGRRFVSKLGAIGALPSCAVSPKADLACWTPSRLRSRSLRRASRNCAGAERPRSGFGRRGTDQGAAPVFREAVGAHPTRSGGPRLLARFWPCATACVLRHSRSPVVGCCDCKVPSILCRRPLSALSALTKKPRVVSALAVLRPFAFKLAICRCWRSTIAWVSRICRSTTASWSRSSMGLTCTA